MIKPLEFVIEGCKGAGKGTTIQLVSERLIEEGVTLQVSAPFNEVRLNHKQQTGEEDFAYMWNKSPEDCREAEKKIEQAIWKAKHTAQQKCINVLLFDRGWITTVAALEDGVFANEEEKLSRIENCTKEVPPTFFLRVPAEVVMQRRGGLFYDKSANASAIQRITRDCLVRDDICTRYSSKIVRIFDTSEGIAAFRQAAGNIAENILASLKK